MKEFLEDLLKTPVKESGEEYTFVCPFHEERTPSCFLNSESGQFFCFGCKKGGSFKTFLELLGLKNPKEIIAKVSFRKSNKTKESKPKNYSHLDEDVLLHYNYRPQHLIDLGFPEKLLWSLKIGFHPERNRIIYPIRDHLGNLTGVSGGTTIKAMPKYKFYRGSYKVGNIKAASDFGPWFDDVHYPAFEKSLYIWNFHNVYKKALSTDVDKVVIVEGFKACLHLLMNGYESVALMGSSLSNEQADLLSRLKVKYYLMMDNDPAGKKGIDEAISKLIKSCDLFIVEYNKHQPDDLSAKELDNAIASAKPVSSKSFNLAKGEKCHTIQQKFRRSSLLPHHDQYNKPRKSSLLSDFGKSFYQRQT